MNEYTGENTQDCTISLIHASDAFNINIFEIEFQREKFILKETDEGHFKAMNFNNIISYVREKEEVKKC